MQIVAWNDWLNRHIPYYEKTRQHRSYESDPPAVVLVLDPIDRSRRKSRTVVPSAWESTNTEIKKLGYRCAEIFLDNDTHQRWYWAFWNEQEALVTVLKLS